MGDRQKLSLKSVYKSQIPVDTYKTLRQSLRFMVNRPLSEKSSNFIY